VTTRLKRRTVILVIVVATIALTGAALNHPIDTHLRAMSVLLRFSDPQSTGLGVHFAQHPVKEQMGSAQTSAGTVKYRLYIPGDVDHPAGLVVAPGIHRLGIEDPRLISLSRSLAGAGVEVMTPEISDLADYRVTLRCIDQIGTSAVVLSTQSNQQKVGVMGLSFAGGLALLAATRPEYAEKIGFVATVGSHDDLVRVSRFFATNSIEKPDGSNAPFQAHEYGVLVLAYSHVEDFFSRADAPKAREALRLWLWEKPDAAMDIARRLSPEGQREFDELVHHHDLLRSQLLREVELHADEMRAVSPHGQLEHLNVPVLLLHATGDSVIPASETLWLQQDVPAKDLKAVVISPALIHVSMEQKVPFSQKWELVDFMAKVIDSTEGLNE
jgi:pimeloyl-ACP methyl ester carboxylesterase